MKKNLPIFILFAVPVTVLFLLVSFANKDDKGNKGKDEDIIICFPNYNYITKRAEELAKAGEGLPDINVTKKLKVLSWIPIDETLPTAELFKARYGIPDKENGNNIIELNEVVYDDRYNELTALVQSGDIPDMIPFEERNFPYGAWKGQYEPVDGVIDFSGKEWDNTRDVIELFKWGGKTYCPITEVSNSSAMLYYRESVRQGAGLPDPQEMWEEGSWDWDSFRMFCEDFDFSEADKKWGIIGTSVGEAAVCSTGVGLVSIEDGKLKSNMGDPRVERAMDFVQELVLNEYRYPHHQKSNFAIKVTPFIEGKVLFWADGPWTYQEKIFPVIKTDDWHEKYGIDEVRVVPFPRDPDADEYYQRGRVDTFMLVAGSDNKEGYKAWQQCAVVAAQDEAMRSFVREKEIIDHGWIDKLLTDREAILDETVAVWDFKDSLGEDMWGMCGDPNSADYVYTFGESYANIRNAVEGVIMNRIQEMNESIP